MHSTHLLRVVFAPKHSSCCGWCCCGWPCVLLQVLGHCPTPRALGGANCSLLLWHCSEVLTLPMASAVLTGTVDFSTMTLKAGPLHAAAMQRAAPSQ
jgi:hypothetical protein